AVAAPAQAAAKVARAQGPLLLERRLPGFSEPVAAIALGGLKSLLRAPESKLMLMTPLLLGAAFGSMIFKLSNSTSDSIRALVGVAAIGLGLFGSLSLVANQFGFDRDGFRVFVLSSVPRRDILLGKNMSFAPLALAMSVLLLVIVEVVCPLRWDHLLSMAPQFVSMYLLFCALMNLPSIYAPMHIAAGSMKPSNQKLAPVLLQLAMTMLFLPLIQVPTLLPLGIEALLERQGWTGGVPIALLLSLALAVGVVFFYLLVLKWEGHLFQAREQRILDVVTNRAS
ncbi:MAG TPA: ABC transporter permease, partial [Pirellulales bacterium]